MATYQMNLFFCPFLGNQLVNSLPISETEVLGTASEKYLFQHLLHFAAP